MSQTIIPFGDVKAQKKWAANLAVDQLKKSYFSKKFVGKGDNNIIEQKTELETDKGDRISFDLSVQLRGKPTEGDNRVEGKEENLKFYTDEVIIDQTRKAVSAGGRMTRKRTAHDMRAVARNRLGDYWSKYLDELMFMYLSGGPGVNEDYTEDEDYTGHAGNPFQQPDAQHLLYPNSATSKATITVADGMTRELIEAANTTARMMRARDPDTANMVPCSVEGEDRYVTVMSPFQEHFLRTDTGDKGWLDIQKAAAAAEGSKNKIFKGGLGMIGNTILHSHESVIRYDDYGAGADLPAARALYMGRQAGMIAYGVSSAGRFMWKEETKDYENEPTVVAGTIVGLKKTRFNNRDFGVMSLDTYAKPPRN
ncbi:major capsid protein, N4-gp56 family [Thioclava dalianensis]|uniref:N4-gp56 family major capsid protein n=1 Tax=Thioclava dalianensis TaxID=1185766 RepID=UPI00056F6766|nr:N4-gp56 family major capsid protein [Thioclava dalianensis]SFN50122.1 major capsid protein, N4-gp56 family [Thioclava dalianensis]